MFLLFSCSVVSNSLRPHGLLHTRLSCPSLSPGVCSNSCPLSRSHPVSTVSSSVPPSPPALNISQHQGLFPVIWLFISDRQSIGASELAVPINIKGWFLLGLLRVFSSTRIQKHQFFGAQPSLWSKSHIHT